MNAATTEPLTGYPGEQWKPLPNRASRRAQGVGVGLYRAGQPFRRPSSRVRAHRVPFDPTRAQRPSSRLHGATRHGQRREQAAARIPTAQRAALTQLDAGDLRNLEGFEAVGRA